MRLFTVDAFTKEPFKGNPAAVCVLEQPLSEGMYVDIAQEMNLSETAFVYKEGSSYRLRWFTPTSEVDLCGHATLATAKILFEKFGVTSDILEFNTKSGVLTVKKTGDQLEMNFPLGKTVDDNLNDDLITQFLEDRPIAVQSSNDWCLVEVETSETVQKLIPKLSLLLEHEKKKFIITAKSSDEAYDFVSRFFAPDFGINEDPVTGSAHCYLAHYWSNKLSKSKMIGYQASKRGGIVACEMLNNDRVILKGNCVIMTEILVEWNN